MILKKPGAQTKMVDLAISILKEPPDRGGHDTALRNWAMDVIDRYSEAKLPREVRASLEKKALPAAPKSAAEDRENFKGVYRRSARTSIAEGPTTVYPGLESLLAKLPPDEAMQRLDPPI